jgi:hypothetical protein
MNDIISIYLKFSGYSDLNSGQLHIQTVNSLTENSLNYLKTALDRLNNKVCIYVIYIHMYVYIYICNISFIRIYIYIYICMYIYVNIYINVFSYIGKHRYGYGCDINNYWKY